MKKKCFQRRVREHTIECRLTVNVGNFTVDQRVCETRIEFVEDCGDLDLVPSVLVDTIGREGLDEQELLVTHALVGCVRVLQLGYLLCQCGVEAVVVPVSRVSD